MIAEIRPEITLMPRRIVEAAVAPELTSEHSRVTLSQPDMRLVRSSRELLLPPTDLSDKYRELETIALSQKKNRHPQEERFAIFLKNGTDLVGGIQIQPNTDGTTIEVSWYLDDEYRQAGYLADAIILLREYAVASLQYQGISTRLRQGDAAAARQLAAAGFLEVGRDRFGNVILEFRTTTSATPAMESAAPEQGEESALPVASLE